MSALMLDAALAYARHGWAIVPLISGTKKPHIKTGRDHAEAATCDVAQVTAWWERYPDAGIGVVCAAAGFLVIDVDDREEFLAHPGPFPPTCVSVGREGRFSLWYRVRPGVALPRSRDITAHVEMKAAGSLVVAPPSTHPTGRRYRWDVGPSFMPRGIPLEPQAPAPWMLEEPAREEKPVGRSAVPLGEHDYTAEGARRFASIMDALERGERPRHHRLRWAACRARELADAGHLSPSFAAQELTRSATAIWAGEDDPNEIENLLDWAGFGGIT